MVPYKPIYGVGVKWERVDDEYMVSMSDAILLPVSPLTSPALPAPPTNDSDHDRKSIYDFLLMIDSNLTTIYQYQRLQVMRHGTDMS